MLRSTYVGFFQLRWIPEALLRANDFALLRAALTQSSRPGTFDEDKLAGYRAAWAEPDALRAMLDWYRALPLARPRAGKIDAPVRIVWGEADSALEPGLAEAACTTAATRTWCGCRAPRTGFITRSPTT